MQIVLQIYLMNSRSFLMLCLGIVGMIPHLPYDLWQMFEFALVMSILAVGVECSVLSSHKEFKDKKQRSKVQQSLMLHQCYCISLHEYISEQLDLTMY